MLLDWIEKQIELIEKDSRFETEPVAVQINAPLALIQVALKTRLQALQEVRILLEEGGKHGVLQTEHDNDAGGCLAVVRVVGGLNMVACENTQCGWNWTGA